MNKDLHNIDDIFNSAQQRFEEDPSADMWDKINAGLDKKDAESYRRRFIGWKRIAIILMLLLSGFVLYESGIIRRGPGSGNKNAVVNNNSVPVDQTTQNDNAVNISKREPQKDINNAPGLPDERTTSNEANNFKKPVNQQEIVSDKEKTKIIREDRDIGTNQIVTVSGAAKKNKIVPDQQLPISTKQNKPGNGPVGDLLLTDKHNKRNLLLAGINNNLVDESPVNETSLIKKIRISDIEQIPIAEKSAQVKPSGKSLFFPIPDSVLSKSITIPSAKTEKGIFKPYWTIAGFASNGWAQYKLDNDEADNNSQVQNEKEVIANREKHESSFSTGIMVTWQFKKQAGFKTGLIYSNTAIVIDPQKMFAAQTPDGDISYKYIASSGYAYVKPGFGLPPAVGDSLNATSAQHKLQSLSIPVLLMYKIANKKFSIAPSAGFTANLITSAKIETEVKDASNTETVTINGLNGTKHFFIGFMADVNLQYNLDKRWAFNVLPTFNYAISPITKSNVVRTFPYSWGLGAGLTYKF